MVALAAKAVPMKMVAIPDVAATAVASSSFMLRRYKLPATSAPRAKVVAAETKEPAAAADAAWAAVVVELAEPCG